MTQPSETSFWWRSPSSIALFVFLGIAAFFLITEHIAHLIPVLPWLFLLACPLIHVFMHGSHGDHQSHSNHDHTEGDNK